MESNDGEQHQSTRSPAATPRAASTAAAPAVSSARAWWDSTAAGSCPADQHGAVRVRPPTLRPQPQQRAPRSPARPVRTSRIGPPGSSSTVIRPVVAARHSLADMTPRRIAIVPHTHWDREWYEPYQEFRLNLVDMLDTLLPLLESDASYPVLHAGRADGGGRRLPRGAARGRGAPAGPGGGRPDQHGALVHPDGRVPGLGRDHHPQPADGPRPWRRLRRRHGRRLPARHVRAHRPDAADPATGRIRPRRRLARRAVGRSPRPGSSGRRPTDPPCGPSTSPSATATGPPSPTTPRRSSSARPTIVEEVGTFLIDDLLCMNGSDHLMPQPWLGPGRGRGQRSPGRPRLRGHLAPQVSGHRTRPKGWSAGRASFARASGPTC